MIVATFPNIINSIAVTLALIVSEAVALFLVLMVVLTIMFLAFVGLEVGRFASRYL